MTAYWVAKVNVTDRETYAKYIELAGPAAVKYGGVNLARGGAQVTLEGEEYERTVIWRFDSVERGVACYNSPEYKKAKTFAEGAAMRLIVVVEGVG